MRAVLLLGPGLTALALAGCAGTGFTGSAAAPEVAMPGRWMLAAPNAPPCGMEFRESPASGRGTLAPDGGCPGQFYLSRRWAFEDGMLVIKTETEESLAQFAYSGGRFEGKSAAGLPVSLSR